MHYQLLKHLPDASLLLLLNIFNKICISGDFPSDWRKAIIIPIPKPGKDPTNPTNYRPIALTSYICKTMERMINRRLVWYLESHKLLTNVQCGLRSRRSTDDHFVRFETFCREAFIHNQHLVSVFFDLEKAYDTTWKYGIMKDLNGFGLIGRLPNFISKCLHDRSFKVRVGSTFSDSHPQEMGVPQGSILSVTLFSVKINSITQCLKSGVDCSLYLDDFQVCYRSSNMSIIERQLQLCLNKHQQWATDNGFQFSKTKTVCMHICQKRGLHLDPQFFLDKSPIPVVEETKFLGVIFDRRLSFVLHLKYIKKRGLKALNILKVIGNTEWGADSIASKYIVFTDSLSCLQAFHHMKLEHPLIGMVIRKCVFLNIAKKDIVFCWVSSHTGIKGNEKADLAANSAKVGVPYTDFKHSISQYIFSTWQDGWNGAVMNKLHSVKPLLGNWQSSYRRYRKDEVALCRARIGHTHLTHSYILRKDPPPLCEHCQCILTVRHILVECNHFARERKDIFRRRDVVESFRFHQH